MKTKTFKTASQYFDDCTDFEIGDTLEKKYDYFDLINFANSYLCDYIDYKITKKPQENDK